MLKVILTKGLPASGKSTWAKEMLDKHPNAYKRINKDDLRDMLDDGYFSKGNEKFVLNARDMLIIEALKAGKHVIIDDTNLAEKHLRRIKELVKGVDREVMVEVKEFDTPLSECIERDSKRDNPVGAHIIKKMHDQFQKRQLFRLVQDPNLPKAIICDLDGTLALFEGDVPDECKRNPYDASTCENDMVRPSVETVVRLFKDKGYKVIFLSGRKGSFRPQTEAWLEKYEIPYDHLWMRDAADSRPDYQVKSDLYYKFISGRFYVEFVLDDRDQVVDLWRSIGLDCFQVNYGSF